MKRRDRFGVRIVICTAVFLAISVGAGLILEGNHIQAEIYLRIAWYLALAGCSWFVWQVKPSVAFYYAMWSFVLWQISYESCLVTGTLAGVGQQLSARVLLCACMYGLWYAIAGATVGRWMSGGQKNVGPRQLTSGLLIFVIFELIAMVQRRFEISAADGRWIILFMAQCLIVLVLYLQNEVFKKSALRQELALMELLRRKEQEQYRLSKENIEIINRKCHDLKHQIRAIRESRRTDTEKYLKEIEDSVKIYESIADTGNEVLDTILTEKSLYCNTRNITVSCVADGSQMGFIDTMDVYSLLGNALDNAIEAVEQFEEKEKRQIDVVIYRRKAFLVINIVNPSPHMLTFEGTMPVTTKEDKNYHGFGVKSIKHIVKKYGGYVEFNDEGGSFSLEVLIPIPNAT